MKRLAVTISLILVVVLALSFLYVSRVAASKAPPPSVQMLSTSYADASTSTPVETLTFSVANPAKLEVTSLNYFFIAGGAEIGGTGGSCQIILDGAVLRASSTASSHPDLTVTDSMVSAGSHTLEVQCTSTLALNEGTVSAIITTGL